MAKISTDIQEDVGISIIILTSITTFIIFYFTYLAFKSNPLLINELDSLGQHIPLAKAVLDKKLFNPPTIGKGFGFYMPVGEIILALFMFLRIPLGLYNLTAYLFLLFAVYKLGLVYKLNNNLSLIYALSVASLLPVLRLIPTQKNDIWLLVFFILTLISFNNLKKSAKSYFNLGICSGLMIGTKYFGLMYFLIMTLVFLNNIKKIFSLRLFLYFIIPFFLLGGIWYLRNYLITGNPFYPVNIFGLTGNQDFIVPSGFSTLFDKQTFFVTIDAFLSEYLIWGILFIFLPLFYIIKNIRKNIFLNIQTNALIYLLAFAYLFGPSDFTRVNITSNMRFLLPSISILFLLIVQIVLKFKLTKLYILIIALSFISVLPNFNYYPKLNIIWLSLTVFFLIFKRSFKISLFSSNNSQTFNSQ